MSSRLLSSLMLVLLVISQPLVVAARDCCCRALNEVGRREDTRKACPFCTADESESTAPSTDQIRRRCGCVVEAKPVNLVPRRASLEWPTPCCVPHPIADDPGVDRMQSACCPQRILWSPTGRQIRLLNCSWLA